MDKRYQVFVSSTYDDLQKERQEVMQALLELDCIPSGMELFPAANEDQWTLIKKVIDECDYYIVIIAGRYGSIDSDGESYTEKEYKYALSENKPIIAFLHKDLNSIPQGKSETEPKNREKLNQFRELAKQKMCRFWTTAEELGSVVSRSMIKLIKSHPAIGWMRADEMPDPEMSKENIRLRKRIEELEERISSYGSKGPEGIDGLAQGDDIYELKFKTVIFDGEYWYRKTADKSSIYTISKTWNEIIKVVLPKCIPECTEREIQTEIKKYFASVPDELRVLVKDDGWKIHEHDLLEKNAKEIIIQLKALGLITPSIRKRSLTDRSNYWTLTPYGENMLDKICAIRKD